MTADGADFETILSQINLQSSEYQYESYPQQNMMNQEHFSHHSFSAAGENNGNGAAPPERNYAEFPFTNQELNPNASYFEPTAQEWTPSSSRTSSTAIPATSTGSQLFPRKENTLYPQEYLPQYQKSGSPALPEYYSHEREPQFPNYDTQQSWANSNQQQYAPASSLNQNQLYMSRSISTSTTSTTSVPASRQVQQIPYRAKSQTAGLPPTVATRPIPSRALSNDLTRDPDLELTVSHCTRIILFETPSKCLKSVELANSLRDRIGKDSLQRTKTLYGGLLVLLELFPQYFFVHRIPKNDMIELIDHSSPYGSYPHLLQQQAQTSRSMNTNYTRSPLMNYQIPPQQVPSYFDTLAPKPEEKIREIKPTSSMVGPARPTDHFITINDVPETVSGGDLWKEFGGNGIVQKVSLDFKGNKRTGIVYFTSDEAAINSFNEHSTGKWNNRLTCYIHKKPLENLKMSSSYSTQSQSPQVELATAPAPAPSVSVSVNSNETRLITIRSEQLPHFYQEVLRGLCNFTFLENDPWKRNVIADYLFCQLLTEMLKPQLGMPTPVMQLRQQLRDAFGRTIFLPPFKAFLAAYPEYFIVDEHVNFVRVTGSELPSLSSNDDSIF